tara:strand:+ start:369 stop:581 length:213 start_codon:yes stop_codon:yes gene_type:complete
MSTGPADIFGPVVGEDEGDIGQEVEQLLELVMGFEIPEVRARKKEPSIKVGEQVHSLNFCCWDLIIGFPC